jgi:hypothetical protein
MPIVITEDIFLKAAYRYCERTKQDPNRFAGYGNCGSQDYVHVVRDELEKLHEKIASLYDVGALIK